MNTTLIVILSIITIIIIGVVIKWLLNRKENPDAGILDDSWVIALSIGLIIMMFSDIYEKIPKKKRTWFAQNWVVILIITVALTGGILFIIYK